MVATLHGRVDDMNRLTKLVHSESTTSPTSGWGSDPLAGYQFSYDAGSRFTSINSYLDGVTNYAHDDTNQLVGADHATATDESYEYDANGNRAMSGYTVASNNRMSSDGTYNYTYDLEGNRATRTKISNGYVTEYTWDFRNRLTKITEEDNSNTILEFTENFYDAGNQWVHRRFDSDGPGGTAAVDTYFAYESGQAVLEFDGSDDSDLSHRYTWGELVDQAFADETVTSLASAGTMVWLVGDHLGTIKDLITYNSTTDDATVANHREWDSYGNLGTQSNVTYASTIGYTGRMWDITTGLQFNVNRWYDPVVGRWMSEDPIGFEGGDPNILRYVANESLNLTDPTGLELPPGGLYDPNRSVSPAPTAGNNTGPGMGASALWAAYIGGASAGKYLTYPTRWSPIFKPDFSRHDAALDNAWQQLLPADNAAGEIIPIDRDTTRFATEVAAATAATSAWGAGGLNAAAHFGVTQVGVTPITLYGAGATTGTTIAGLSRADIQNLIRSSGDKTITLYTRLCQAPVANRQLYTSTSQQLAFATPNTQALQVYSARLPFDLFQRLLAEGAIRAEQTQMADATGRAYVISAQAMTVLHPYFEPTASVITRGQ